MAGGVVVNQRGVENFATYCRGGGNFFLAYFFGGAIFLMHYFANFFHESDITCIITVVGAQQQHKGMLFLNMGGGQIFPTVSLGVGGALFFAYRFCRPPPPTIPRP